MAAIVSVDTVRQWIQVSLESLGAQRAAIDSLNVFPVPDGDTGTNMYMTLESTAEAIDEAAARSDATLSQVGAAMARGALLGARGNSGVILAQILRALAFPMERPLMARSYVALYAAPATWPTAQLQLLLKARSSPLRARQQMLRKRVTAMVSWR